MRTPHHAVDTHFFMDTSKVLLADIRDVNDLAGVDPFGRVDCGAHGLLPRPTNVLKEVSGQLSLAHFAVLALSKDFVHENDKVVHFSHLRLFSPSWIGPASSVLVVGLLFLGGVFDWQALCGA